MSRGPGATRPRVLLTALSLDGAGDGVGRAARLVCRVLAEEVRAGRCEGRLLLLREPPPEPFAGLPAVAAHGSRMRFLLRALPALCGATHLIHGSANTAQVGLLAPARHRPSLTVIHGIEVWEQASPRWLRAARHSDTLVANTRYTRDRAERLHGGFARALPCWLATESDAPPAAATPLERRPPEVLSVGRMDRGEAKGQRELVESWPRVVASLPEAVLHLVGRGSAFEELRQLAAGSSAAGKIRFHGFLPDAEVERLYARVRAFSMPSRGEGFGIVYAEAMRFGLPVVASLHDAASEIVRDDVTGYTVDLAREGELAERLLRLLRDGELAARLGAAGQERWRKHFGFSAFRERFQPILADFLARGGG